MKTKTKVYSAGKTYFVVLKERTSSTGFYDDACYAFYLLRLMHCLNSYRVKLHAYLLRPKEIWLLITPGTPTGFDSLQRFLNRAYSDYFNNRFKRSEKVWSDSPISCLIPGDGLVLDCQKFIEREPLRTKCVLHPGEYLWSSYCTNSFSRSACHLTSHVAYKNFLKDKTNCFGEYREFIATPYTQAYYLYLENRLLYAVPMSGKKSVGKEK